jgi:hypothetical protein
MHDMNAKTLRRKGENAKEFLGLHLLLLLTSTSWCPHGLECKNEANFRPPINSVHIALCGINRRDHPERRARAMGIRTVVPGSDRVGGGGRDHSATVYAPPIPFGSIRQ